jgi:hypothetical protein
MQHLVHEALHRFLSWPDRLVNAGRGWRGEGGSKDARPRVCAFQLSECLLGGQCRRLGGATSAGRMRCCLNRAVP